MAVITTEVRLKNYDSKDEDLDLNRIFTRDVPLSQRQIEGMTRKDELELMLTNLRILELDIVNEIIKISPDEIKFTSNLHRW